MPSKLHEILLAILKQQPKLLETLLKNHIPLKIPKDARVEILDSNFTELDPSQFRPDALFRIKLADGKGFEEYIVFELQLRPDPEKPISWLAYSLFVRKNYGKFPLLIVLTPNARTARWARKPYQIGFEGAIRPFVIGPEDIPKNLDLERVKQEPMLGLLSLLAHGKALGQTTEALAEATFLGLEHSPLNPNFKLTCLDLIHPYLPEALMQKLTEYKFQTPGIQKAYDKARNEGLEQGKLEGLREGKLEGLSQGKLEGLREGELKGELKGALEGQRRTLLRLIERKFGAKLSAKQFKSLQSASATRLDELAEQILDANSIEELFGEN